MKHDSLGKIIDKALKKCSYALSSEKNIGFRAQEFQLGQNQTIPWSLDSPNIGKVQLQFLKYKLLCTHLKIS